MPSLTEKELSKLLDSKILGKRAHSLEIISRWSSLRVIDYLFREGPATTGEIARGVNMDMREIRETVDRLNQVGVTEQSDGSQSEIWTLSRKEYQIVLHSESGLAIDLWTEPLSENKQETDQDGFFTRIGQYIDSALK